MSITDELREYARGCAGGMGGDALRHIADRIDREHRMAMEKVAAESDALPMTDESMAEHGWIRLPLDADGVPIRIGDEVYSDHHEDGTVRGIQFYGIDNGSIRTLIAVKPHDWHTPMWWRDPKCYRRHTQTVEDVLREFADEVQRCCDTADTIAEYAAKLRLAEEVDE